MALQEVEEVLKMIGKLKETFYKLHSRDCSIVALSFTVPIML